MTNNQTQNIPQKKQLSPKVLRTLRRSEEYKLAGEHRKAINSLEKLLIEDPGCLEAVEEIADNLLSLDEYEKAERTASFALAIDQDSFIANHVLGFLRLHDGKWKEAVELLQKANEGYPNHPEILRCLGWGLFHKGDHEAGLATLERALNLQADNPMILCDLGVCLLQEGELVHAKDLFKRALVLDPDSERIRECLYLVNKFIDDENKM